MRPRPRIAPAVMPAARTQSSTTIALPRWSAGDMLMKSALVAAGTELPPIPSSSRAVHSVPSGRSSVVALPEGSATGGEADGCGSAAAAAAVAAAAVAASSASPPTLQPAPSALTPR